MYLWWCKESANNSERDRGESDKKSDRYDLGHCAHTTVPTWSIDPQGLKHAPRSMVKM